MCYAMLLLKLLCQLFLTFSVHSFVAKDVLIKHEGISFNSDRIKVISQEYYDYRDNPRQTGIRGQHLHSIPLRHFKDEITFLSNLDEKQYCINANGVLVNNSSYELHVMDESDISNVAQFIVRIFGGDAINLSQNLTTLEKIIMSPAVDVVNGYSSLVAFAEVYAGLRSRLAYRFDSFQTLNISAPKINGLSREEQIRMISCTSLVLVLSKALQESDDPNNLDSPIIASVELRLQPCDAKIPFTLPWIDILERKLFPHKIHHDLQPYLSNLCVDEEFRGCGIGNALVACVEDIAKSNWGYKKIFLHVDLDNEAALKLYTKAGYNDVGRRWDPFWAGKSADIGYFVKNLTP